MGTDIDWRWADPSGQQRRIRTDELRAALASGVIAPNTPVWRRGWKEWQPAESVPELTSSALAAANGLVPNIPPPPLAVVAVQAQYEAEAGSSFDDTALSEPPPPPAYVPAPIAASTGHQHPPAVPPAPESSSKSVRPSPKSIRPAAPVGKDDEPKLGKALPTTMGVPALTMSGHGVELPPMPLSPIATPMPGPTASKGGVGPQGGKASTIVIHGAPPPASASPMPDMHAHPINVPAPTVQADNVEELSGSAIIPDSVSDLAAASAPKRPLTAAGGTILGMQAPTQAEREAAAAEHAGSVPSPLGGSGSFPDADAPRTGSEVAPEEMGIPKGLRQILHDMRTLRKRNKFALPVAGGVGALAFLIIFGLLIRACFKKDDDGPTKPLASASASATGSAIGSARAGRPIDVPPPPPASATTAAATTTSGAACSVAGAAKIISPRAVPASGIEIVPQGSALAVGFATTPKDGLAVQLDPGTLDVTQTAKLKSGEVIRRLVPTSPNGKLAGLAETDKRPKRTVWTDTPIDVGVVGGQVVASPFGQATFSKLFAIEGGDVPLDALRGVAFDGKSLGKGYAIAFRRSGAIWMGAMSAEPIAAKGPLLRVSGLGPQVGQPAIGASGDAILVAWADRAAATDNWAIRWVRFTPGELAPTPKELALPAGGLGGSAMAPSLVGLSGDRFLLAWTEGSTTHQIRALTIGADGQPIGSAVSVSADGVNAGQGQAGVLSDGRGVVAYLGITKAKAFEVVAVPIKCN